MDDKILKLSNELIKKFIINIRQIISNSDNDMCDIESEAYIITYEHYEHILKNERVFINEMRKKCLRNNKYGKRIESMNRWEYFNSLESSIPERTKITSEINEDLIVGIDAIKQCISDEEYNFLITYYDVGSEKTSEKYCISNTACRQKVHRLKRKILEVLDYR